MTTVPVSASFADFARLMRVKASYVTQLKRDDRLVLTDDGKAVRVAESIARIAATRAPEQDATRARHAAHRAAVAARSDAASATATSAPADDADVDPAAANVDVGSFQNSRAVREQFLALEAKRAYEVAVGKLVEIEAVTGAVAAAATTLRAALETLPDVLAPQVVALDDEHAIRALIAETVEHALTEASRALAAAAKPGPG